MNKKIIDFINKKNIYADFKKFYNIYKKRPISNNENGIKIEHAFYLFLVIKKLKPKFIIESGVFAGQSTWLMEKFCPQAKFFCFDLNLKNLKYKSKKAKYFEYDLTKFNWSNLQKNKTLIFFDDHVSFYERLEFSKKNKFKNIVFDDNYPPYIGDCYSFKKILAEKDQKYFVYEYFNNFLIAKIKYLIKNIIGINKFYGDRNLKLEKNRIRIFDKKKFIKFNKKYKISFFKNKEFYFEFPPLITFDAVKRWKKYKYLKKKYLLSIKFKKPLFKQSEIKNLVNSKDLIEFSKQYNFFCFYRIKY